MVCKLLKTLYGLKQSPRFWSKSFLNFLLQKLGLLQINVDHSIFVIKTGLNSLVISTFVNNIKVIALKKSGMIYYIKAKLVATFFIVDISSISFYLGLKIEQNQAKRIIKFLQLAYINKVLSKFYLN